MKTIPPFVLVVLFLCSGCATRYDLKLTNGMILSARGKPRVDEKHHVIIFKDANGKTNSIPQFRVTEIAPHSTMAAEESDSQKQFNPVMKK